MAYQPASVLTSTSGLSHLASIYYDYSVVDSFLLTDMSFRMSELQ